MVIISGAPQSSPRKINSAGPIPNPIASPLALEKRGCFGGFPSGKSVSGIS
jgi:hypothetical protein